MVDPQRDIDRVLTLLEQQGVRLTHVFETHIHNDYVTGGLALAQRTGAHYLVNGEDDVSFSRIPVADGQVVEVGGRMRITALATPGHTFTHLSYLLSDGDEQVGVFSGGSLLYGATGRPDLLGHEHTHELVRHQHASAHRLADLLPDDAQVFPTHGFGSFCSATQSDATSSTIGREKRANPVLTQDEQTYVDELLAGLGPWPAYYAHMAPANAAGPSEPDLSPPAEADASELRRRIEAGEWVVDLRTRTAFAAGHAPGTLNFGLDGGFATYLGWLITWGTPDMWSSALQDCGKTLAVRQHVGRSRRRRRRVQRRTPLRRRRRARRGSLDLRRWHSRVVRRPVRSRRREQHGAGGLAQHRPGDRPDVRADGQERVVAPDHEQVGVGGGLDERLDRGPLDPDVGLDRHARGHRARRARRRPPPASGRSSARTLLGLMHVLS